jgi:hypothetical protein
MYTDAAALISHLKNVGPHLGANLAPNIKSCNVHGPASELKEPLAALPTKYWEPAPHHA